MISCLRGEWLMCIYPYCSNVCLVPVIPAHTNKSFEVLYPRACVNGNFLLECLDLFWVVLFVGLEIVAVVILTSFFRRMVLEGKSSHLPEAAQKIGIFAQFPTITEWGSYPLQWLAVVYPSRPVVPVSQLVGICCGLWVFKIAWSSETENPSSPGTPSSQHNSPENLALQ